MTPATFDEQQARRRRAARRSIEWAAWAAIVAALALFAVGIWAETKRAEREFWSRPRWIQTSKGGPPVWWPGSISSIGDEDAD